MKTLPMPKITTFTFVALIITVMRRPIRCSEDKEPRRATLWPRWSGKQFGTSISIQNGIGVIRIAS